MKRVYLARDLSEAQLVCGWLRDRGISSAVFGESSSAMFGCQISSGAPEVWVDDEDAETANAAMCRYELDVHHPVPCSSCGYDMRDAPGPECPKCGQSSEQIVTARRPDWVCPACGETIEGHFSECWKCAAGEP